MKTLSHAEIEKTETNDFIEKAIKQDMLEQGLDHIVTRFPPEPSGFPHLGHLKAINVNFSMADKFGGYVNLRFDDTNPGKESVEYEQAIIEGLKWMGYKWANIFYASDYYEKIYECAELLINKGLAYVCDLNVDEIREYRGTLSTPGKNSPYRERTAEENLSLFRDMRAGKFKDGEHTLRAKIDMSSPNMNMRDPVIYRVLHTEHYRQGNKWCIYPTYDFAHPIEDAIEGITHSLCSNEFEDHRPLYNWVVENCEFKNHPRQIEFVRTNINGTVVGKRYLRQLINEGKVEGWDDPRLPTLSGVKARGVTPTALREFVSGIGVAGERVDPKFLDYCIRDELNRTAPRLMTVLDPLKVTITNFEGNFEELEVENNPNDESAGTHKITFGKNIYIEREDFLEDAPSKYHRLKPEGVVRLKGAYIIKCDKVIKDAAGNIERLECSYFPESKSGEDNSGIKVKGTIHWVNADDCADVTVRELGPLVKEGRVFEGSWDGVFNEESMKVLHAKAERWVNEAPEGARFQFVRKGYYYLADKKNNIFNLTVGLKDSFKLD